MEIDNPNHQQQHTDFSKYTMTEQIDSSSRGSSRGIYATVTFGFILLLYGISTFKHTVETGLKMQTLEMSEVLSKDGHNWTALLKCQEMRLSRLKQKCLELGFTAPSVESMNQYSEKELKYYTARFISDDKHKFILLAIPKTGCSSWKWITVNNSIFNTPNQKKNWGKHNWNLVNQTIGLLENLNKSEILQRFQDYTSVLTVRHPLVRLESSFLNKWHNQHGEFIKFLEMVLAEGRPIDIRQHDRNQHWVNFTEMAHPCVFPFSFISKTETANTEMSYIIHNKLSGYGEPVLLNQDQNAKRKNIDSGVHLPLFSELKNAEGYIQRLMEDHYFGPDMKLFGYEYRIVHNQVIATCSSYEFDGMCC